MACECGACGHSVNGFSKFLKYLLLIINILFFILGIAVLAVGAYTQTVSSNSLGSFYNVQYPIGFIVLGSIVAVFSFFGCCGAWKESKILLSIYAVVMGLLLVAQIAVVSYGASQGEQYFSDVWGKLSDNDKNIFQNQSNCCGFNDVFDRPGSECDPSVTIGCKDRYLNINHVNREVIYAGAVLLAIEFIGFAISLVVCCHINRKPADSYGGRIQ